MSFSTSSSSIIILPDSTLTAQCKRCNGDENTSSINLDFFIGNADGIFNIGGSHYSRTARGIAIKYSDCSTVLHAMLQKRDQSWQAASINLDSFIANQDGELCFTLDSFDRSLEELVDDSAMFWPLSNQSHCEAVEASVSRCGTTGNNLRENINSCIASGIHMASVSVNAAFKAIEQAQKTMYGCVGDTTEVTESQALQLSAIFDDAIRDWMNLADLVGRSSQELKEFQHTTLHDTFLEIGWAEQRIHFDIRRNDARSKSIAVAIKSLERQIELNEGARQTAQEQQSSASDRTIGFSVASVFLPFVFIPLAIIASQEREHWNDERVKLDEKIKNANQEQELHESSLNTLKLSLETAKENKKKCSELRDTTGLFKEGCCDLEIRIHAYKNHITTYQQHLACVELTAVGALQWSKSLEEAQGLLEQALGLRSEMITLREKCLLLGSVTDVERVAVTATGASGYNHRPVAVAKDLSGWLAE